MGCIGTLNSLRSELNTIAHRAYHFRRMAITVIDFHIFVQLKNAGVIPPRPSVIELGESEWYGDVVTESLSESVEKLVSDKKLREELQQRMAEILRGDSLHMSWDLGKIFYKVFLDFNDVTAIDLNGTPAALKLDLNCPVALDRKYDVLINGGTAEHIFNVYQFFKTCHDLTRPGGLMLHTMPFRGALEHGFYNFNPTFYWDLASANGYTVLMLVYAELKPPKLVQLTEREQVFDMERQGLLGQSANLYAVFRKSDLESEFRTPMQGIYGGTVSDEVIKEWQGRI